MAQYTVSVVICTWNRAELLAKTLDDLGHVTVPAGVSWEVIVVDNNSTDNTAEEVRRAATVLPVRYLFEHRQGLSHARNSAIAASESTFLLFTDDDVRIQPQWLVEFLSAAARHPSAGVLGGPVSPWFVSPPDADVTAAFPAAKIGLCGIDHGPPERVLSPTEYAVGANFGVRREAIDGVTFDVTLGTRGDVPAGGEEVVLQEELRKRHWEIVWVPQMHVRHYVDPRRLTVPYLRRFVYHRHRSSARVAPLPGKPTLFGAPRWLWFGVVRSALRVLRLSLVGRRGPKLAALYEFERARGLLRGSLEGHRLAPTHNPVVTSSKPMGAERSSLR